jgi:hypothetical protein
MTRPFRTTEQMMTEGEAFKQILPIFHEEIVRLVRIYGRPLTLPERGRAADYAVASLGNIDKDRNLVRLRT